MRLEGTLFNRRRRAALLVTLIICLASGYMLTYSGRVESGDSLGYFNATGSLVKYGDTLLDLSLWAIPPDIASLTPPFPLRELQIDSRYPPLQQILTAPLYWIAKTLPGLGLVHTVWLFNVLVCAFTGGIVFLYALALGYGEKTGILAALVFGFGTIAWPYSKTFFRDPLAMLLVVSTGLLLERLRAARWRSPLLLVSFLVLGLAGLHTKSSVLVAVPAMMFIAAPSMRLFDARRSRYLQLTLLAILAAVPVFLVYRSSTAPIRIDLANILPFSPMTVANLGSPYTRTALHTYLFSIGGSFWGTSPVLLLALPGLWFSYRQCQSRYLWVIVVLVVSYAMGHALGAQQHWFGGASWPPRFLLPVIPFVVLGTLPVLDLLTRSVHGRWVWLCAAAVVAVYSLWVQFSGVSLNWNAYNAALPAEAQGLSEWSPGLNQVQYLRWVLIPQFWASNDLDFAWVRMGLPGWGGAFAFLVVMSGVFLWQMLRVRTSRLINEQTALMLPCVFVLLTGLGLMSIYPDDLFQGANPALHTMLAIIEQETQPDDVVILSNPRYERFFLNYAKTGKVRFITLSEQPGERPSEEQLPEVVSDNPDKLLKPETLPILYSFAQQHQRLWLLVDSGPFLPWSTRPVERFMSTHFYPIREIQTDPPDPTLRLLEYSTVSAPDTHAFKNPEHSSDLVYGDSIHLLGYDLPRGMAYTPGDVMPVSLYWQSDVPVPNDYVVALKLLDSSGAVVAAGMDSRPNGGFTPTDTWQSGVPVWDNRALIIPDALPPGLYRIGIILYAGGGLGGLESLFVSGSQILADSRIGLLTVGIQVV